MNFLYLNQKKAHYHPNKLSYKIFEEPLERLKLRLSINRRDLELTYEMYKNNLKEI